MTAVCHHCLKTNDVDLEPARTLRITCRGCQRRIYVHPHQSIDGSLTCSTTDGPVLPGRRATDRV